MVDMGGHRGSRVPIPRSRFPTSQLRSSSPLLVSGWESMSTMSTNEGNSLAGPSPWLGGHDRDGCPPDVHYHGVMSTSDDGSGRSSSSVRACRTASAAGSPVEQRRLVRPRGRRTVIASRASGQGLLACACTSPLERGASKREPGFRRGSPARARGFAPSDQSRANLHGERQAPPDTGHRSPS
jgi:hypothetical protein